MQTTATHPENHTLVLIQVKQLPSTTSAISISKCKRSFGNDEKRARAENRCKEQERPHPLPLKEHTRGRVSPSSHSRHQTQHRVPPTSLRSGAAVHSAAHPCTPQRCSEQTDSPLSPTQTALAGQELTAAQALSALQPTSMDFSSIRSARPPGTAQPAGRSWPSFCSLLHGTNLSCPSERDNRPCHCICL